MMAEACSDAAHPGMRGSLKISAPAELAHRFFPRVIGEFSQRYPGLTIHLLVHDSDSNEINPAADITILYSMGDTDWARYWAVPFRAIEFFPVCHPSLLEGEDTVGKARQISCASACCTMTRTARPGQRGSARMPPPPCLLRPAICTSPIPASPSRRRCKRSASAWQIRLTAGDELKKRPPIRRIAAPVPSPGNYYLVAERRKRTQARLAAFMQFAGLAQYLCEINYRF